MAKDKLTPSELRIRELEQLNISMQKEMFKLREENKRLKEELDNGNVQKVLE